MQKQTMENVKNDIKVEPKTKKPQKKEEKKAGETSKPKEKKQKTGKLDDSSDDEETAAPQKEDKKKIDVQSSDEEDEAPKTKQGAAGGEINLMDDLLGMGSTPAATSTAGTGLIGLDGLDFGGNQP